jgi:hypothetical protein
MRSSHQIIVKRYAKAPLLLEELANLQDGSDAIRQFRRKFPFVRYQYSDTQLLEKRNQLRELWYQCSPVKPESEDVEYEPPPQEEEEWRTKLDYADFQTPDGDWIEPEPIQGQICKMWLDEEPQAWLIGWTNKERRIFPKEWCLPIVLAVACMEYGDRLAVCWNHDQCAAPFFIRKRSDQRYCTNECARPAQREAKRKWWKTNRGKNAETS